MTKTREIAASQVRAGDKACHRHTSVLFPVVRATRKLVWLRIRSGYPDQAVVGPVSKDAYRFFRTVS